MAHFESGRCSHMLLDRRLEEHAEVMEFNCVEFVEETLSGHLKKQTEPWTVPRQQVRRRFFR